MTGSKQARMMRRQLFAATGAIGALAATAALLPATREVVLAAGARDAAPEQRAGYAPTQHVLRYYQTTRI